MTDTLQKLFEDSIKDLFNAEKQFLKAMHKVSKAAESPELKQTIDTHAAETEGHIERLQKVSDILGIKPSGKVCKAAQGLVEEADEHLDEIAKGPVLDAAIVVCAQKNEHYEICSYGTLIAWAQELGLSDVVPILEGTLAEERAADQKLNTVAEYPVNQEAGANGKADSNNKTRGKTPAVTVR